MRHCYVLRVFTRGDLGGNHLGVITDVTGLNSALMQTIATHLGFSETVFLDWSRGGVPEARIFTPAIEIPFAGHPLVGAAWVLGAVGPGTTDRVSCGIGEVRFESDAFGAHIEVPLSRDVEEAPAEILAAAGLPAAVGAWMVRLPLSYLVAEMGSRAAVATMVPDFGSLGAAGWEGTMAFSRTGTAVKARFFAPRLGVPEDPATGSAAAALAAALSFAGEVEGSLTVEQGDEVDAPSSIALSWSGPSALIGGSVRREGVRVLEW
jgi:trans-2,3-dihydro-3-hydroxyanthranilate isomerase